jgi:hypothetical protein
MARNIARVCREEDPTPDIDVDFPHA